MLYSSPLSHRLVTPWWQFWKWDIFRRRRTITLELPPDGKILFYKRDRNNFGFLSNFYLSNIHLEATVWPSAEHFYQSQKSFEQDYQLAIHGAKTPGQAKRLGASPDMPRKVSQQSWFRRKSKKPRSDWDAIKLEVMRRAVRAKFGQNRDLCKLLLATGSFELVEDSVSDAFWGIGSDGQGQNWLGRILMEVRADLKR